jgi:hypothetical protein
MARSLTRRALARHQLVSVAGLVGRPIRLFDGFPVGRVADVVVSGGSPLVPAARRRDAPHRDVRRLRAADVAALVELLGQATRRTEAAVSPILLTFILVLANRRSLMGANANSGPFRVIAAICVVVAAALAIAVTLTAVV